MKKLFSWLRGYYKWMYSKENLKYSIPFWVIFALYSVIPVIAPWCYKKAQIWKEKHLVHTEDGWEYVKSK